MTTKSTDIGTVYVITNRVNGKQYVGQTWYDIEYRFKRHARQKKCVKLARAMSKYGAENFSIKAVVKVDNQENMDRLERLYIKRLGTVKGGYNCTEGGMGGKLLNPESLAKISATHKGKRISGEVRRKISENNGMRHVSTRRKSSMSKSKKTTKHILSRIKKMVSSGLSQQHVADELGLSQSYISLIVNGKRRTL
jgi:group I intron endonuclease